MKIKKLLLQNFKVFGPDAPEIDFCDELGIPNNMICIVGNNGSGKSTVLQAIAVLVGTATRKGMKPSLLDWPGWDLSTITMDLFDARAEVEVELDAEEIQATYEFAATLKERGFSPKGQAVILPAQSDTVTLRLVAAADRVEAPSDAAYFQLKGYQYALQLNGNVTEFQSRMRRVGGIYWYHDHRSANSVHRTLEYQADQPALHDDRALRNTLVKWAADHYYHASQAGKQLASPDRFERFNALYGQIFPGKRLLRADAHPSPEHVMDAPQIWFQDEEGHEYELGNISAGERAALPLVFDFANWEIHHSIILIDELELHLHPPVQQMLVRALGILARANHNQVIVTSHSDHVVPFFGDEQIIRIS